MSILEASRNLGAAIQKDERFIRFAKAKLNSDNDKTLQEKIGQFNETRMEIERLSADDNEKADELRKKLRDVYGEIMSNDTMVEYNTAKAEVDAMLNDVNSVIMQCVDGADPETCEPLVHDCGGDCGSCGGCH